MKKLFTTFLTFLSLFLIGQVPQGFSYQAVAFNSAGSPVVSSTVSVRISILDNSVSGTTLYTETHSKTTNGSGLYSLTIGQGTPTFGTFTSLNWAVNSKFVKVELDPTGGTTYTTVGTSQMLSVPYALIADSVLKSPTNKLNFFTKQVCTCSVITPDTLVKNTSLQRSSYRTEFIFHLIDGNPDDVLIKFTGLPTGLCPSTDGYTCIPNNVDTLFYGLYSGQRQNPLTTLSDKFSCYFLLQPGTSLSGNYNCNIEFISKNSTIKTYTREINVKPCNFSTFSNTTGTKSVLTNTCGSDIKTSVNITNTSGYYLSDILNSGSGNGIIFLPDCNGSFSSANQFGNNSYNGNIYTVTNGIFNSTGNLTININKLNTSTSINTTCTITYQ